MMKRLSYGVVFSVFSALWLLCLPSCLKEGDTTILVNDPQEVPFITDYLPKDLLQLYGEEHVYFGDQPPRVEMEFLSNHEYVATNLEPPHAPVIGSPSPLLYYHKLQQQYLQKADYYCKTSEESMVHGISPVYLMGHDQSFTAYFYVHPSTAGLPEHAVLFSGIVTPEGVSDFRYGYKIVRYRDSVPANADPVGAIFIFKDRDGMAETNTWYHP